MVRVLNPICNPHHNLELCGFEVNLFSLSWFQSTSDSTSGIIFTLDGRLWYVMITLIYLYILKFCYWNIVKISQSATLMERQRYN